MLFLIPVALFGWPIAILMIFSILPPRRAVVVCFIGAWLFLPYAGYDLPGLPDYSKRSATSLGVMLGTVIYRSDRLFAVRFRWFDVPMLVFCFCPIPSSLVNGLGAYDGLSTSFTSVVTWGLPYLIGRIYFTRPEHVRELALGIVAGGLIYVPLCAWEFRMSPMLHNNIYGFDQGGFGEVVLGGFRPKVFMSCALECGVWMTACTTAAFWLWASGSVKQIRGYPLGTGLVALLAVAVMAKVAGAWALLILGLSVWYPMRWTGLRTPALALLLVPVLYMTTRSSGLFAGERAVEVVRMILTERRAESLKVRVENEDLLVAKALQMPTFGWGGWGRARVYDENGKDITITDGFWVILIGNYGLVGLSSYYAAMLLPMAMLVRRYPASAWQSPTLAPVCALAVICNLYSIDCIANAMVNPIYLLALGAVTGTLGLRHEAAGAQAEGAGMAQLLERYSGAGAGAGHESREEAAAQLGELARALADHGMTREAEEAWHAALRHWASLAAEHPDDPAYRRFWLDGLNDAAWSLIAPHDPEPHAVERAIALAEQAVTAEPATSAYWNTLGIAYFRADDPAAAIEALEQSAGRGDGGTAFDFFFLAMAHHRQGDRDRARHWFARADDWLARHGPEHPDLLRFRAEAVAMLESHPMAV